MSTATATPRIVTNADGEARCSHRNCWGSVCPTCWAAAPNLVAVYGLTYRVPVQQIAADYASRVGIPMPKGLDGDNGVFVSPVTAL
jgi:hypothetical protein